MPGGSLDVIAARRARRRRPRFALHCDPRTDVGQVSLRPGADHLRGRPACSYACTAPAGTPSRPHLTEDVVFALGRSPRRCPAILARRLDPRAGVSADLGPDEAGPRANAIPRAASSRARCAASTGGLERGGGAALRGSCTRSSGPTA